MAVSSCGSYKFTFWKRPDEGRGCTFNSLTDDVWTWTRLRVKGGVILSYGMAHVRVKGAVKLAKCIAWMEN